MSNDLSISNRMMVACSVVVILFSSTFVAVGISLSNLTEDVQKINAQTLPYLKVAEDTSNSSNHQLSGINDVVIGIVKDSRFTMNMMIAGGTVSAILAAFFGIWIVLGIRRQLGGEPAYAADVVTQVAKGDLTVKVKTHDGDDTSLLSAVRNMVDNLTKISIDVRVNSDAISTASKEIALGNADLSQRAEQQAASLQETASSMAELLSAVHRNAESVKHASQLAQGTSNVAEQSGHAVENLVATMTSINASSKKIEDIISVIDGIAFQTNILALNAAVEAARAGEQGRGFAVVASEVRNLALRSASAAKEIKSLIGESVAKVKSGTDQVQEAADSINDVVTSVQLVASMMKNISAETVEQAVSIEQVNTAINEMDAITQQNAAVIEEAAAAAEGMQEQAAALILAVSMFKLEGSSARVPAVAKSDTRRGVEHHLSVSPTKGSHKLSAKVREDNDGDWKEF